MDDHAPFRSLARALLELDGFDVVGESADAAQTMAAVAELDPDLLLLDVNLPDRQGWDVARDLGERGPRPLVVLVSSRRPSALQRRLKESAAAAFLPKEDLTGAALHEILATSRP